MTLADRSRTLWARAACLRARNQTAPATRKRPGALADRVRIDMADGSSLYARSQYLEEDNLSGVGVCRLCEINGVTQAMDLPVCAPCVMHIFGTVMAEIDRNPNSWCRSQDAPPPQYLVYYVRFGDRVKIGTTTSLAMRLRSVPHDEVLATEPGGYDVERQRHRQFASLRITGEWFQAAEPLLAHIESLNCEPRAAA